MRLYELKGFLESFDDWDATQNPSPELRRAVLTWIFTRAETPYVGVKRQSDQANLWFGRIPKTQHGDGLVVVCAYFIEETTRSVTCTNIATLGEPI